MRNNCKQGCEPDERHRRDDGTTFIEILVAVVLLGTAGVAVLAAMSTAAIGARVDKEIVSAQRQLSTAGDRLTDTDRLSDHYVACNGSNTGAIVGSYQGVIDAALGVPNDVKINVATGVEYWNGSGYSSSCPAASTGKRLQKVRLSTTINGATRTVSVVMRPAATPTNSLAPAPTPPVVTGGGGGVKPATHVPNF